MQVQYITRWKQNKKFDNGSIIKTKNKISATIHRINILMFITSLQYFMG